MRALLVVVFVATGALADDAGILRCRAIKDSAARLSCYDALAVPQASPAAAGAQPKAAAAPAQFGMEHKQDAQKFDSVESTIAGRFEGWGPHTQFRLANGQVWQIADGSQGTHWIENPKVRVRRGLLGAFYLEVEGSNRTPRVKRLQ
jgi:hypothetical protein